MTFSSGIGIYKHIGTANQTAADELVRASIDAGINVFPSIFAGESEQTSTSYLALVVTPSLSVKSTAELVGALKSQPDKFNISVGQIGTAVTCLQRCSSCRLGGIADMNS